MSTALDPKSAMLSVIGAHVLTSVIRISSSIAMIRAIESAAAM
jgi:hypothetical protein